MTDVEAHTTVSADHFVEPAIDLVDSWLQRATALETRADRATMAQLGDLVDDEDGVGFVMQFVDRIARPEDQRVAAAQLESLVRTRRLPGFLSPIDKLLLHAGGRLAPILPAVVMALANRRMRSIVGHLVAPATPSDLGRHLGKQRSDGYDVNVNLLGEAVLGEREADARLGRLQALLAVPDVDYVSVKITAVASQINHWAYDQSLARITRRLAELVDTAAAAPEATFINFDMEEYHDLHLTVEAFKAVLNEPDRQHLDAGIVLQAYLPDAFEIMKELVDWSNERHRTGGGTIKIRLVKGANLAMEQVDAAMHGWPQAPFSSKLETDAGYRACLDWALRKENLAGTRIGVASHNLFDVAWAKLLADGRNVSDRVQYEMLQGMAPGQAKAVNETTDDSTMLLYTPAVDEADFDVAIGYLFRRLEENAAPENFMRKLFDLEPGSPEFDAEADFFREGVRLRTSLDFGSRRDQDRTMPPEPVDRNLPFTNASDTDPSLPANRAWIAEIAAGTPEPCVTLMTDTSEALHRQILSARGAQPGWWARPASGRREVLHRVGDELERRRGDLMVTMMHEASKTIAEADIEISEAIDFARWYGDRCRDLDTVEQASFSPLGVIAVIPPWNFPTAIPAGGVLASLAAGNAVVFKPAPQTPRCAELVAEACWAAGVPGELLHFVRTPDNEIGQELVEAVDGVILTGSSETADLFRSRKPDLRIFAETSGKNALIITPSADIDLAVEDLVRSAFGHAGQKCSAASLAVLVGDVATSERFQRQLVDAVESLTVGSPLDLGTDMAPLVGGVNDRLERAVAQLDTGESWLVTPTVSSDSVMSPGVRAGVKPGSWFHRTECFGPVLGLMAAADLDEAIAIANSSDFGLTGGIHTLDPNEVAVWAEAVEVGNGYVNRPITGAIVQRQPFGGWKRSSVGPGAKAGGVNYLFQLGTWTADRPTSVEDDDFEHQWQTHFALAHDETGLFCEANIFRYRPMPRVGLRCCQTSDGAELALVHKAARIAGVSLEASVADSAGSHVAAEAGAAAGAVGAVAADPDTGWLEAMHRRGVERVRFVGVEPTADQYRVANGHGVYLATEPVTASGRIELRHYVREQAMSVTLHRFGNLVNAEELHEAAQASSR